MPRLAAAAALLLLILGAWLLFLRQDTALPDAGTTPAANGTGATAGGTADAPLVTGDPAAGPERRDAAARPTPELLFTVTGMVLADRASPDLSAARVVAYRGEPGDRGGILPMNMGAGGNASPSFVLTGEPIAEAAVDAAGNFTLRTAIADLRLGLEHDLYALPLPEVVHVPRASRQVNVTLAPMLGGMLRGRLLGERSAAVTAVRLFLEADPMSVMRDSRAFLGAMTSSMRPGRKPGPDGTFVFRGVVTGASIALTVEGDAVMARTSQPALEPGEVRDVVVPVRVGAQLDVTVVDAAGAPIEKASVSVRSAAPASLVLGQLMAVRDTTGPDGICRLRGMASERVRVEANAKARVAAGATVELLAGDAPQTLRLELGEGGKVTGTVATPDGKPLAEARVAHCPSENIPLLGDMATQLGPDQLAAMASAGVTTDAAGRFELTGLADEGTFLVVAAHPDWAAGHTKGVRMGDRDVLVTLQPLGGVRGRVVAAEDEQPLGAFTVSLLRTSFLVLRTAVRQQVFDASAGGAFELGKIPAGDYTLQVSAEGRSEAQNAVTIGAATTEAGTIVLARAATIAGFVRDENGQPVRGALVRRRQGAMADNPMLVMFGGGSLSAYTDAEGRFRLAPLAPGKLQLLATADGFASGRSERVQVEAGQAVEGVTLVLGHGGSIRGRLLVGSGQRADEFLLTAQDQVTQSTQMATAAADGTFHFENLEPGQHTVQAMPASLMRSFGNNEWRPGQSMRFGEMFQKITDQIVSQRCAVRAGETAEVTLDASEVTTGSRWIVRVEIGGQPFTDGLIEATAVEDGHLRVAMLIDGAAAFSGIRPGSHRLQVRGGMTMTPIGQAQDAVFPSGAAEHKTTLSLPGGELRGRVVDARTGQPLATALVRLLHDGNAERDDPLGMALTEGNGAFRFPGLVDGTYSLIVAEVVHGPGEGSASRRDGIRVSSQAPAEPVELRAQPAASASVLVTTANGSPLAGATVLCVDADGHPLGAMGLSTSGPDGRAWFGGMPRGRGRVVGRAPGFAPGVSDLQELGPDRAVEFTLPLPNGARTVLQAVDRAGQPLRGATLTARCNGGPWLPSLLLVEGLRTDGGFELGRLGSGRWEFRITHPVAGTLTQERAIADESSITVVIAPR